MSHMYLFVYLLIYAFNKHHLAYFVMCKSMLMHFCWDWQDSDPCRWPSYVSLLEYWGHASWLIWSNCKQDWGLLLPAFTSHIIWETNLELINRRKPAVLYMIDFPLPFDIATRDHDKGLAWSHAWGKNISRMAKYQHVIVVMIIVLITTN